MLDFNHEPFKAVSPIPVTERERIRNWILTNIEKGKNEYFTVNVDMTPLMAEVMLEFNEGNRPIRESKVRAFSADMANNYWIFTGEPFSFSVAERLISGQHRCLSSIRTGKTIRVTLGFGVEEKARNVIDTGSPRTPADFAAALDKKDGTALSAVIRNLIQYDEKGRLDHSVKPSTSRVNAVLLSPECARIESSLDAVRMAEKKGLAPRAVLAFCHYVFVNAAGQSAADAFFAKLTDGFGLYEGDPIHCCRDRLADMKKKKARPHERAWAIIRCWNAWRRGKKMSQVKMPKDISLLPEVER